MDTERQDMGSADKRIAGFFLSHIGNMIDSFNGDSVQAYCAAGINPRTFNAYTDFVNEDQLYDFLISAVKQTEISGFGLTLGGRFGANSFGLISQAIMSCVNLEAVLSLVQRYSSLIIPLLSFSSETTDKHLLLEVHAHSVYPDLNRILIEAFYTASLGINLGLKDADFTMKSYCFTFDKPEYAELYPKVKLCNVEFGASRNLFVFKLPDLKRELNTANVTDFNLSIEQCEQELLKLQQAKSITERVIDCIRQSPGSRLSSHGVADSLNLTERTLRRKLAREGANYRELVKQVKIEQAKHYLEHTSLQVGQIAVKLGYKETSSFRAAFKAWTGKAPREWRINPVR